MAREVCYAASVPARGSTTADESAVIVWVSLICMRPRSRRPDPLEVAMVVTAGAELREVAAITLPVDREREVVQQWFRGLDDEERQRHRASGMAQEVLSNGLLWPMVVEALEQTLSRVVEPGVKVVLGAEDPQMVRSAMRSMEDAFADSSCDLSLQGVREWAKRSGVTPPEPAGWGIPEKPYRVLDHCLEMVAEAREYLAIFATNQGRKR